MRKHWKCLWVIAVLWCLLAAEVVYGKNIIRNSEAVFNQNIIQEETSDEKRVFDLALLLEDGEEEFIQRQIEACQVACDLDIVVVTTEDAEGMTATEYADGFYEAGGFGRGNSMDGILFLIDLDNRELAISTEGKAVRIFTDERIEIMLDHLYKGVSREDYAGSVSTFVADVQHYSELGIPGNQYHYNIETGESSSYKRIEWYEVVIAFGLSAFAAGTACLSVKHNYAMEEDSSQQRKPNMGYQSESRFVYQNQADQLIDTSVTSYVISKNMGNSGLSSQSQASSSSRAFVRGSSSGHSRTSSPGRSTVHRSSGNVPSGKSSFGGSSGSHTHSSSSGHGSSGGRIHGGGSRKF